MTTVFETMPVVRLPDAPERTEDSVPVPTTLIEILACGAPDRGDDGAAVIAVARLADDLPDDVRTRTVPKGAGAIVVDTATGVDPGWIVEIPFSGLAGRESGIRPRSSHALSIPETIGVASIIRGRPLQGMVVAIGGVDFGFGEALSWPVAAAMDALVLAIADAVGRVRELVVRSNAGR